MHSQEKPSIPDPAAGLRQRIDALATEIKAVQAQLVEQLRAQPDHPEIQRMRPRSFSMPVHCLDQQLVLDPFRYDWRAQCERLAQHVTALATKPAATGEILASILVKQKEVAHGRHYCYAPEVIERAHPTLEAALALIQALRHASVTGKDIAS